MLEVCLFVRKFIKTFKLIIIDLNYLLDAFY